MGSCGLIKPRLFFKQEIIAYRQEMLASGSSMDGIGTLREFTDVPDWLARIRAMEKPETLPLGLVTAEQYLYVREADGRVGGHDTVPARAERHAIGARRAHRILGAAFGTPQGLRHANAGRLPVAM